jgi:ubiquitin C-terminal hydrolase
MEKISDNEEIENNNESLSIDDVASLEDNKAEFNEDIDQKDDEVENEAHAIGVKHAPTLTENIDLALTSQFYNNRVIDVSNLPNMLNKNSNHGLTGLKNLGNSCYMSTIIQCLSHSLEFLYYFLSRGYASHKPKQVCDIMNHILTCLWIGNDKHYNPINLRQVLCATIPGFNNTNQQDSHECMMYLLDHIHEELNTGTKSGEELTCPPKFKDESETSASKRFWNFYKERHNSVVVDLFHGQLMNNLTCLVCYHNSITFEPFVSLLLPIPNMKKVDLTFVPFNSIKSTIKFSIYVPDSAMFYDMDKYLNKYMVSKITNFRCLIIHGQTQNARFVKNSDHIYNMSKKGHIFVYEYNEEDDEDDEDIYPIIGIVRHNGIGNASFPRIFPVNIYSRIKQLRMMIYGNMKKYCENTNSKYAELLNKYKNENLLETSEYETVVNQEFINSVDPVLPYEVYLVSMKEDSNKKLIFSGKNKQDEYLTTLGDNQKIEKLLGYLKHGFKLVIEIGDKDVLTAMNKCSFIKSKEDKLERDPTLDDCLDSFTNYEKLEKGHDWYCTNCKKIQHTLKKMDIFYIPKYFIITLKRYTSKLISKTQIQLLKNNTLVKYPINKYNLSNYCLGPKNPQIYELYAISQHSGSLEGGHYATACRNFGKWYEFDDISVFPSDEEIIIGAEAYILFYRRNEKL